jgi:enoyl-CoA hydratase/carnithine racemase
MMVDLAAALREAAETPAVRVVILSGAGERAFCTGYDLTELRSVAPKPGSEPSEDWASSFPELTELLRAIEAFPMPLIASLGGHAIGGGALLASFCDFRIARMGVRFEIPASRLGVLYPLEGIRRLVALLGSPRAASVLLRAASIDSAQGLACGLYEEVVPTVELDEAVNGLADDLALRAPLAVAGMRATLRGLALGRSDAELSRLHGSWTARCLSSDDLAEGLSAALGRREPRFEGS